jgi:hypothetical protein
MKCTVNFKRLGRGENPNSLTMFSLFLISYVAFLGELGQAAYKLMRGGRK